MNKKVRSILFSVLTTALITTGSWTGYAVGGFSGQSNLQSQIAKDNATSKAKSSNVKYIYVEKPQIQSPMEQNIAVSFDSKKEIEKAVLNYMSKEGKALDFESVKKRENKFRFTKKLETENNGIYDLKSIKLIYKNGEKETLERTDFKMEAGFGVDKEYLRRGEEQTEARLKIREHKEKDGIAEIKSSDVDEIANQIERALKKQDDKKLVSNTHIGSFTDGNFLKNAINAKYRNIKKITLDPGHDIRHQGGSGNGINEAKATLKIAKYLKEELEQYGGIEVQLSRGGEACPYPGTTSGQCIKERIKTAKSYDSELFISLHLNSGPTSANGAEVWYRSKTKEHPERDKYTKEGGKLGRRILDELKDLGIRDRGTKQVNLHKYSDYIVNRYSGELGLTGLIVEHGFMTNKGDASNYLNTDEKLKRIAKADARGIVKHLGLSKEDGEWVNTGSGKKFLYNSGRWAKGLSKINGKYYYFNESSGIQEKGWKRIDGKLHKFYDDEEGDAYIKGWKKWKDGSFSYCYGDGVFATGLSKINGKFYYLNENGIQERGWKKINGKLYKFYDDVEGDAYIKGWKHWNDSRSSYCYGDGVFAVGPSKIDGKMYLFDEDGMQIKSQGFKRFDGKTYYVGEEGELLTGAHKIHGKVYYFNKNGVLSKLSGWQKIDGDTYYYDDSENYVTGLQRIDGKYYYFNEKTGAQEKGWKRINGKLYKFYDDEEGDAYIRGWKKWGHMKYSYCYGDGVFATGLQKINGKYYYFDEDGIQQRGWKRINGKLYKFYDDVDGDAYIRGWKKWGHMKYSYCYGNGVFATGLQKINGKYYYFDEDGIQQRGWKRINGKLYKFYDDVDGDAYIRGWKKWGHMKYSYCYGNGVFATGLQKINGKYYYFDEDGIQQRGWKRINGKLYKFYDDVDGDAYIRGWKKWSDGTESYCYGDGIFATGRQIIDGKEYIFDENGIKQNSDDTHKNLHRIDGRTSVTWNQLAELYKNKAKRNELPKYYLSTDAPTLEAFCKMYIQEAKAENIRAEVAFVQAMKETGWLRYGGDVRIEQNNFAGIGAVGGGAKGHTFATVREGIRGQIQHLKAYANKEPMNNSIVDPRFKYVERGSAKYIEWLGIYENPRKKGWAASKNYGFDIVKMIKSYFGLNI